MTAHDTPSLQDFQMKKKQLTLTCVANEHVGCWCVLPFSSLQCKCGLLRDLQQMQQYTEGGRQVLEDSVWLTVCGNSHYTFKWELPRVMYKAFYSPTVFTLKPFIDHENKPKHIYLPARVNHSSGLNIFFPGCHRFSRESSIACFVSEKSMISGKW